MALTASLASAGKGLLAGAAGTLAMDALWYRRSQADGGDAGFLDWELSDAESFDDAGAPAQTAKKIVETATPLELPDSAAGAANNTVHWATGLQWGALYSMATRMAGTTNPLMGLGLGTAAFGAAYTVLPLLGVYKPITDYDRDTLVKDFTAHLVFGVAAAAVFRLLERRR